MSRLLLRAAPPEPVLRSVDRHPGIVGVAVPDDVATLISSPTASPHRSGGLYGLQIGELADGGMAPDAVPLDVEEAAEACEGTLELQILYAIAAKAFVTTAPYYLEAQRFDLIETHFELVKRLAPTIEIELRARGIRLADEGEGRSE